MGSNDGDSQASPRWSSSSPEAWSNAAKTGF